MTYFYFTASMKRRRVWRGQWPRKSGFASFSFVV